MTADGRPEPLWDWEAAVHAAGGIADGIPAAAITGFSIDTRSLMPGDVFVALQDVRDGHQFVTAAFAAGASAAIVSNDYVRSAGDGALLRVGDPLSGLGSIAAAARARTPAQIVAVTGSVGKTGTKEMLRSALGRLGSTHAAEKSFNNHWGVPLTVARMPAASRYAVFEIGMNHAGEITPLTRLVRPHVAIVTAIEPVHIEYLGSIEAIARAKAEIFLGLEPHGTAVINKDAARYDLLRAHAIDAGARILTFGTDPASDVRAVEFQLAADGSTVTADVAGQRCTYRIGAPGAHIARNSLAVLAALSALELPPADVAEALSALAHIAAPKGRGARTRLTAPDGGSILLIDESYNANPASVRAALAAMATVPRDLYPRRIAVLGEMLELGAESMDMHAALAETVDAAGADLVFATGPGMRAMFERLPQARRAAWAATSAELEVLLLDAVHAGDVVMIKGSLGTRMGPLVEALTRNFAATA